MTLLEDPRDIVYCDNCAEIVWMRGPDDMNPRTHEVIVKEHKNFMALPYDVESANAGESGTVCWECHLYKTGMIS